MASLSEETAKKVLRQVEFYFSDSNLPRDDFLKKSISESEDGMISLALICSFSRMRGHLSLGDLKADAIPEDSVKAVAETLRKSTTLKISEDGQKVGRATEILKPEEVIEQVDIRTVAAAPLEFDVKLEDVETFFGQFGKVNSVRLPRHVADKKLFCGTALVEFSTEEDANKILKETLNYEGVQLELKPKKEFDTERAKETEEYEKTRPLTNSNRKNNAKPEAGYPKGLIVAFKLRSSSEKDSAEHNGTPEDTKKVAGDVNTEDAEKDNKENVDEKNSLDGEEKKTEDGEKPSEEGKGGEKEERLNAVETYKDNMDVVMREDLKTLFGKFGTVKYIDFKIGEESGFVRFEEPEAAHKARAAAVLTELGGLVVKNFIATLEPVSGEAEKEYWKNFRGSQEKFRESKGGHRGRGGKHHRGGYKHGRSRDDNDGGRPNKHRKF
ncbi:la protein 1 [Rosa rugosa]|uniref:la protein 1 n=1 Tax=Rosa rugosa TaxID=74645 RepID=UPI002B411C0D|nr:la protein 1 [Rosa rugosa]